MTPISPASANGQAIQAIDKLNSGKSSASATAKPAEVGSITKPVQDLVTISAEGQKMLQQFNS